MDPVGAAHVTFGLASIALGAAVLSLPKGANLHRALGVLYVLAMFGLNVTALLIYKVFGRFGVFHWLAISSLATLLTGYFAVLLQWPKRGWLDVHYYCVCWSFVGLLSATAAEILVRVVHWPLTAVVMVPTTIVVLVGGGLTGRLKSRTFRRLASTRRARPLGQR